MKFKDKIVLVLGGTGDIGSAISLAFEKEGAKVCRHGRSGEYAADLRDENNTNVLITKIIEKYRQVDVLVNAVSHSVKIDSFDKKNWSDFDDHLQTQLKGGFNVIQKLLPSMKERKIGRI